MFTAIHAILNQTGGDATIPGLPTIGSLGASGIAGLIFYFYRKRETEIQSEKEKRAEDFRKIVESNTQALTEVRDGVRELTGWLRQAAGTNNRNGE